MRSFSPASLVLCLGVTAAAFIASGCGNDVKSRLIQIDDFEGEHLLGANTDGQECLTSANCEDGDLCTENRCVDRRCVSMLVPSATCCDSEVLFEETFDGSITEGVEWSQLNGAAGWQVIEQRSASPPNALYFGDPGTFSYDVGEHVAGEVKLPAITLPLDRETVLTMRLYALIETSPEFDLFWVKADVLDGGEVVSTVDVMEKTALPVDAYQDFALVSAVLEGLEGATVQVRFGFDSIDHMNNNYEGIYVDDIQLIASCPIATACATDSDCDDGDACTVNACNAEVGCVQAMVCQDDIVDDPVINADNSDPCALSDAPADCCTADSDCDDGNPLTVNVCEGGSCVASMNPDSCVTAADCDDVEACTTDSCHAGLCQHAGGAQPGCCVAGTVDLADFDNESLQGLYVTDNFETGVFWTPDKTRSTTGDFSLYCGDPRTQTYTIGTRVKSSATTRVLEIPKGGVTVLTLDLYKATRNAKHFDVFQALVLRDGVLLPAWSSKALSSATTNGKWQRITIPLHGYAGQEIQVRLVFDSVDAPTGAFEGVYIDGLKLETVCE